MAVPQLLVVQVPYNRLALFVVCTTSFCHNVSRRRLSLARVWLWLWKSDSQKNREATKPVLEEAVQKISH
jgi:hypothetical protein